MKYRKGFFAASVFPLLACVMTSFGQSPNLIPPKLFPQTQSQTEAGSPKHPVNIYFKNGNQVSGDLVQTDPADPDAIVVEIAGLRQSIKLDDLIRIREDPRKFDEYHLIAFNDEKARLDNLAIEIQNNPTASAYIIGYGANRCEGQARADRAREYLVNSRGVDPARVVPLSPGCQTELLVQLWIVPVGASPPPAESVRCGQCPAPPPTKTVRCRRCPRRH